MQTISGPIIWKGCFCKNSPKIKSSLFYLENIHTKFEIGVFAQRQILCVSLHGLQAGQSDAPPPPICMTENHFRSHFSPFQINTQLCFTFFFSQNGCRRPFWNTENHFRSYFSPFQINAQILFIFSQDSNLYVYLYYDNKEHWNNLFSGCDICIKIIHVHVYAKSAIQQNFLWIFQEVNSGLLTVSRHDGNTAINFVERNAMLAVGQKYVTITS